MRQDESLCYMAALTQSIVREIRGRGRENLTDNYSKMVLTKLRTGTDVYVNATSASSPQWLAISRGLGKRHTYVSANPSPLYTMLIESMMGALLYSLRYKIDLVSDACRGQVTGTI